MAVIPLRSRRACVADLTDESLTMVGDLFDRYVVFPSPECRDSVVLWALHAHVVYTSFSTTPRLSVCSKEPGSGKSLVLELLAHIVPNPMLSVHLTPGVVWRSLEHGTPTLLMDEADTIFGKAGSGSSHRELRGILNAGYRRGARVPRCVGSEDVRWFNVFGPVAFAGIGQLPETLATRSIVVRMRKRRASDPDVQPFDDELVAPHLARVFKACEVWGAYAVDPLKVAVPDVPVINRAAQIWRPLVAIADLAGSGWGERARVACKQLTEQKPPPLGELLLAAVRDVFRDDKQLSTGELMGRLAELPDPQWRYDTFTGRAMSRLLAGYDVRSQTIRVGGQPMRGYTRKSFEDAWGQYLDTEESEHDE